ncbi:MAG: DUF3240 family protein [Candidatus Thiodiazotropha sp. (ex Cardiolucina cf. quadrata)]|nr:DUF3240 family protein [Candidatus Thiodiazotropha sp. (ex Cardiolucina cf. quadrata)]
MVGHSARLRVDILLDEASCEQIIAVLKESEGMLKDHAVYWVTAVDSSGHI